MQRSSRSPWQLNIGLDEQRTPETSASRVRYHTSPFIDIACTYQTNSVPVGHPDPVLLRNPKVLHNNGNGDERRNTDGCVSGGRGDGKLSRCDSLHSISNLGQKSSKESSTNTDLCNSRPSSHARSTIRARFVTSDDARRRFAKEDEKSGGQEQCDRGTKELSGELNLGLGTKKVPGLKVTNHVSSLGGSTSSNSTSDQVDALPRGLAVATALGNTTENDLRGFGNRREWVDVGITGGLYTDEREDEGEEEGQNRLAATHPNRIRAPSRTEGGLLTLQRRTE
jgi:hypothetical protein